MIWKLLGRIYLWHLRRQKLATFDREQLDRILSALAEAEDRHKHSVMRRDAA